MNPVLVLGSRTDGHRPDALLASRLEQALPLIRTAGIVVVSGAGEAHVMARWLLAHGVDAAKIVEEPEATSTNENLEKAHALRPETVCWTVVTNDFHVLRTRLWARHLDIPARVVSAPTPAGQRLQMYLRECLALPHSVLRVLWRRFRAWGTG